MPQPPREAPIPYWLLVMILVIAAAATYIILPSRVQLLERQVIDESFESALHTLQTMTREEIEAHPERHALLNIHVQRRLLGREQTAKAQYLLVKAIEGFEAHGRDDQFLQEVTELIPKVASVEMARDALDPLLRTLPVFQLRPVAEALTREALAEEKPVVAAEIFERLWFYSPDPLTTERMTSLWRSADHPERALTAIEQLEAARPGLASPAYISETKISLLRELGRPRDAFLVASELIENQDVALAPETFKLFLVTALEAEEGAAALPYAILFARQNPRDSEAWKTVAQLALYAGELEPAVDAWRRVLLIEGDTPENVLQWAKLLEWSAQTEAAFDQYVNALELGQAEALDRLFALSPMLFRDAQLAPVVANHTGLLDERSLGHAAAQLFRRTARFDAAIEQYQRLLAKQPDFIPHWIEYGGFMMQLFEYGQALEAFRNILRRDPQNLIAQKLSGETLYHLGRFQESFSVYNRLIEEGGDAESFEAFLVLAESLGLYRATVRGLEKKIEMNVAASPADYLRLAHFLGLLNQPARALTALRKGLKAFPRDPDLRLQAAYALSNAGEIVEARAALEGTENLGAHPHAAQLYLSLLILGQKPEEGLSFIQNKLAPELLDHPGILELRAQIHELLGELPAASDLFAKLAVLDPTTVRHQLNHARMLSLQGDLPGAEKIILPLLERPTPLVLKLAAQIYAAAGQYKIAEKYQRIYLAANPEDLPEALGFLGDILLSRGAQTPAKRVYRRSLDALLAEIRDSAKQ